jgi:NADPH:quinone reductase-like Zn-dependent oxidoreductase
VLKIQVDEFGAPEVLRAIETDSPAVEPDRVVIRSEAIGVNFADVWTRLGAGGEAPVTPGIEVAGLVSASGSSRFAPGDRVVATPYFTRGAYAQEVSVPAELVFPLPEDVGFDVAAALPLNYLTAYAAVVERARPRRGESVLVTSGAGGVGLAAVDLARDAGAEVFATASPAKHDFLRGRGVAGVVDSRSPTLVADVLAMTGGGVDVVVDGVGSDHFRQGLECLRYGGRVVAYGFTAGIESKTEAPESPDVTLGRHSLPLLDLFDKARSFMTADAGPGPEQEAAWLEQVFGRLREGRISPRIDRVFPLRDAAAAHHYLQDRKNVGKVLLDPSDA